MKIKCDQCGNVYTDAESCPLCGAETVEAVRVPLDQMDRDSFWQEVKYSDAKTESDK